MTLELIFRARLWLYEGAAAWHFVTLPADAAAQLHTHAAGGHKAFGTLRVTAQIGATRWKTSLFRDRKRSSYLLPLKSAVRTREQLRAGDEVEVLIIADLQHSA